MSHHVEKTENITTIYREICSSFRDIDNLRAGRPGLLPTASLAAIIILERGTTGDAPLADFFAAIGLLGIAVALGLFIHEMRSINRASSEIRRSF